MSTGDQNDVQQRTQATLPPWFGDIHPVVDAMLAGASNALAYVYSLYQYAVLQVRIRTATDDWLDLVAFDFFGYTLTRTTGESDTAFRARILAALFKPQVTRQSISDIIQTMTGYAPRIIEPGRTDDTLAFGQAYYGAVGLWGDQTPMRAQSFMDIYIPPGSPVTQEQVYTAINNAKAEGTQVWVQFVSSPP